MTAEKISRQYVNLSKIKSNPNNPRIIKDDAFKKLVQSLKDFPEMIEAREIARKYIEGVGGFEKFAEWGLV